MAKITFIDPEGARTEAEAHAGKTLLEIAEDCGAKLGSACGGVCACSSCHCYVRHGAACLDEMSDAEEDRLDMGFDVRPYSRLGCQVKVPEAADELVIEISQESIETWYNEHPEHRHEQKKRA